MKIPIIFLGTGQAIPTIKRNHTSILLEYKDENLLIDCGEGTQRQFRKLHLNPGKITRLLITHWHGPCPWNSRTAANSRTKWL